MSYIYKFARTKEEFEQIYELNYQTFVLEIPQHPENTQGRLVDRFDQENQYIIALKDQEVIGMIAIRAKRPFSLDEKLQNIDRFLPEYIQHPCEVRLLSVKEQYRVGRVFFGLATALTRYCLWEGYDAAVISGTTRQLQLYEHFGFKPFAHLVGSEGAYFQPMIYTIDDFYTSAAGQLFSETKSYLPGPVKVRDDLEAAYQSEPLWHRSPAFKKIFYSTKCKLQALTNAKEVEIVVGTGTLANDMVAARLKDLGKGLIISNGEFGERLIDHAVRHQLDFETVKLQWATPFPYEKMEDMLQSKNYEWIWFVHGETSTGMLNDLDLLRQITSNLKIKLCVDCISTIGAIPINLGNVYLATGVSGKALASYTGLSFLFHQGEKEAYRTARYLDYNYYQEKSGVPFSHSSHAIQALEKALNRYSNDEFYEAYRERVNHFSQLLQEKEIDTLKHDFGVFTIVYEHSLSAKHIGEDLMLNGYFVHYLNSYLLKQNWLQIALYNHYSKKDDTKLIRLIERLHKVYHASVDMVSS